MNIFDFENNVRSASNKQKHDLDIEGLLGDLNLGDGSSRRRLAFLPYFGLLAVVLAGALMFFTYSTRSESSIVSSDALIPSNEVNLIAEAPLGNQVESAEGLKNNNLTSIENKATAGKLSGVKEVTNEVAIAKKSVVSTVKNSITRGNANTQQTTETILSTKNIDDKNQNKPSIILSNIQQSSNAKKKSNKVIASAINQKQNTSTIDQPERRDQLVAIDELPTLNILLEDNGLKALNKKVSDCPKFSEGNWNLSVVPEVGVLFPIKSLSLKEGGDAIIFDDRESNESSQLSYQFGVGIQFRNKITGLYIRPGFSYSIINETFTLENTRFVRNETTYELRQFNIPIAIGGSLEHKKFSFDMEGGIIFNFLQKTKGALFNGGENFIPLDDNQDFFKQSTGLGFFAGAAIKSRITNRAEIYLGTRFYINTLSNSSNQNPIDQRYSFIGLHTGVVYTLF